MNADTTRPQEQGNTEDLPDLDGEWEMKRLGDICSIRNQKVLPSNIGPDTLCVELDHIGQYNGRLLKYSTAQHSTSLKYRFFAGDILFGRLRSYLRKFWHADQDGICTTEIWPLVAHPERVDSGFLYAIIQSDQFIEASRISYGTHMPRSDWNVMRNFEVNLPSLTEQRAIAEVLSDVDGLIRSLDALIAKKRAIKQAAMQQLLTGKTRLPGFSGEWRPKMMRQIGLTYGGLTGKSKSDFGRGTAHYVTFLNVLEHVIVDIDLLENVFVNPSETQNRVLSGDLLFNGTSETPGDLAMGAVVQADIPDLYLNSFCFGFRIYDPSSYDAQFLAYFFRGPIGRQIMYALAQGATRYNMSKQKFLELEINLPSVEEQTAIAVILSDMDAEIAALERRRDKTCAIKQGMMQQLLTGRVRLIKSE